MIGETPEPPHETVDWASYAREYDLLMEHNPPYQELVEHCVRTVKSWALPESAVLANLGGGTGNLSVRLAQALPGSRVLHADTEPGLLEAAVHKARELDNWQAVRCDLDEGPWLLPPLDGVITVHVLYASRDPKALIGRIAETLRPGGYLLACDLGRRLSALDWGQYLVRESVRSNGLTRTLRLLASTRQARRASQDISRFQDSGRYWLHDLGEYRRAFEDAGFEVLLGTDCFYRGYDDLIVARKPVGTAASR